MSSDAKRVLDHGFVRLVDKMGSDLSVVRAARVSYDAAWRAGEDEGSDHRLINYLARNRHTTPFEAVEFQFEVKAPIFVLRQWHRHRTWTFNELSARYRELPEEFYVPERRHVGVQSTSSKQARDIEAEDAAGLDEHAIAFIADLQHHSEDGFIFYRRHLAAGVPRELARLFLGLNTYSHQFAKIDLHNLFGFLNLRLHSHAQHEIRVYAEAMRELARAVAPISVAAWEASR
jgi:thymidylate synthase (FAD)